MSHILPGILSLIQYKNEIECQFEEKNRPEQCECCGKLKPWRHGDYTRKTGRDDEDVLLNPIHIQRYYCSACKKTMSALPECIPPRRWYLWKVQQAAILLFLLGKSARAVEKQVKVSRHTVKRWAAWLMVQFRSHKDALCTHYLSFGLFSEPVSFWNHVFDKLSLSTAMRLCHASGVAIP
jgi:transposase-like protein